MKMRRSILLVIAVFAVLPVLAKAQALADSGDFSGVVASMAPAATSDLTYTRPTEATKLHNYIFDAFGPYPMVGAAFAAGIGQAYNTPPEWKQGAVGYSKRFGSDFGIATVSTTARYGLAQAFRQDTLYYRCECKGVLPRLRHAVISTLTARQGKDGHRVFSFPGAHRSLRRYDDCRLRMVSGPLQRQGRTADGQLHHAGICGREHRTGIPLQRPALIAFSHAPQ